MYYLFKFLQNNGRYLLPYRGHFVNYSLRFPRYLKFRDSNLGTRHRVNLSQLFLLNLNYFHKTHILNSYLCECLDFFPMWHSNKHVWYFKFHDLLLLILLVLNIPKIKQIGLIFLLHLVRYPG